MADLELKNKVYLKLIKSQQDKNGFIESGPGDFDSLLYSGLTGCVPGFNLDILKAFNDADGTWHRKTLTGSSPCCGGWNPDLPANQEKFYSKLWRATKQIWLEKKIDSSELSSMLEYKGSTISRDMLTGLAWYAWANRRLDISESVVKHAVKHCGVMGKGDPSRINIMPSLFATFCWISFKLGGPSRVWARWIPADFGSKVTGYQAHLQVLHILLREELTGKISKTQENILDWQANREPNNPLFLYATGQDNKMIDVLSREDLWPSNRLPQAKDRYSVWIPMNDEGDDWAPVTGAAGNQSHSGGDFLFCYWLLKK